jgi:hypothetical protein
MSFSLVEKMVRLKLGDFVSGVMRNWVFSELRELCAQVDSSCNLFVLSSVLRLEMYGAVDEQS